MHARRVPGGSRCCIIKPPLAVGLGFLRGGLGAQAHRPRFSHPGSCSGVATPACGCATFRPPLRHPHRAHSLVPSPYALLRRPSPPLILLHVPYPRSFLASQLSSYPPAFCRIPRLARAGRRALATAHCRFGVCALPRTCDGGTADGVGPGAGLGLAWGRWAGSIPERYRLHRLMTTLITILLIRDYLGPCVSYATMFLGSIEHTASFITARRAQSCRSAAAMGRLRGPPR